MLRDGTAMWRPSLHHAALTPRGVHLPSRRYASVLALSAAFASPLLPRLCTAPACALCSQLAALLLLAVLLAVLLAALLEALLARLRLALVPAPLLRACASLPVLR